MLTRGVTLSLVPLLCAWNSQAAAKNPNPLSSLPGLAGQNALGLPLEIVILLTLLTLVPAIIASMTPFLRITIVLHFLRQALGTQTTPSNQVLLGLALFLSLLIMQPVMNEMYEKGWEPFNKGETGPEQAFVQGTQPLKTFLLRFVREKELQLFIEVTHASQPKRPADLDLRIIVPAYILSELKAGFQIGAVLFLPFLIIDVVVASVTLAIGMVQLPPVMISAPFKILLFVLVDGWNLVVGSLVKSFY